MTKRHAVTVLLVCAGVVWLYGGALSSLVSQWASDDDYSHGFFVIPLAAFFAWERRAAHARAAAPSAAGLLLVGASSFAFLAGILGAELFLTRSSLIGVLAGAVLFVWGREHFRILFFRWRFCSS